MKRPLSILVFAALVAISVYILFPAIQGSMIETSGARARSIRRYLKLGVVGRWRARSYVSAKWIKSPPTDYQFNMLMVAEPAFIGISSNSVIELLGKPDSATFTSGVNSLSYTSSTTHARTMSNYTSHVTILVASNQVQDIVWHRDFGEEEQLR